MKKTIAIAAITAASTILPFTGFAVASAQAATRTTVQVEAGQYQSTPKNIDLAIGDGADRLVGLSWTSWGRTQAVGHGTDSINTCEPICAAGNRISFPVTVTLGGVKNGHFTKVTVARVITV